MSRSILTVSKWYTSGVPAKKPYHHGDLRSALLSAVAALVSEKGIEALSLRECARRAGASWSAPAHHFGDKTGLLTAFAIEGFERLSAYMEMRRDAVTDAGRRAAAVGEGYLEFALRHRGHFRVMFRTELLNENDPAYQRAVRNAFRVLEDGIRDYDSALNLDQPETLPARCLLAWSTVHGFATLCLEGAIFPHGRGMKAKTDEALETGGQLIQLLGPSLFPEKSSETDPSVSGS
jgi:AcrR family transcriptional regulator